MALDLSQLVICGECSRIKGAWQDGDQAFVQECDCFWLTCRSTGRGHQAPWPGFDFNQVIELCRCCAAQWLPSGSRHAVWFCGECRDLVGAWHANWGEEIIPLGRTSRGTGPFNSSGQWNGHLAGFSKQRVVQVKAELGLTGDVRLRDYLMAIQVRGLDKRAVFEALRRHFVGNTLAVRQLA